MEELIINTDYRIWLLLIYIWFIASWTITYQAQEITSLAGWEKLLIFFGWPIVLPCHLISEFVFWLYNK
jgi:hypothetical protein